MGSYCRMWQIRFGGYRQCDMLLVMLGGLKMHFNSIRQIRGFSGWSDGHVAHLAGKVGGVVEQHLAEKVV